MTTGDHMSNEPLAELPAASGKYPERTDDPPGETVLTLAEAAARLGLDVNSVRRKAKAGQLAGAYKRADMGGEWRIPVTAVEGAQQRTVTPTATAATDRVADLERELATVREQLAVQRALADERKQALEALHASVRALGAGRLVGEPVEQVGDLASSGELLSVAASLKAELEALKARQAELKLAAEPARRRTWWQRALDRSQEAEAGPKP